MFLLKKLVSGLLMPISVVLMLLISGLIALRIKRFNVWGYRLLRSGLLLLLLLAFKPIPWLLVTQLEHQYDDHIVNVSDSLHVEWIVVLGGGISDNTTLVANGRMSRSTLARVVEGVRLAKAYPQANLMLSGGAVMAASSEASVMESVVLQLGVSPDRIFNDDISKDTDDQARILAEVVGDAPMLLVTSALHMPRSMALFRKQDLSPLPAPTDRLVKGRQKLIYADFLPSSQHIFWANRAWHEYMGITWSWLRGQI